ncbi:unnamed protein product [Callosobruchus maculatus]|uniref:Uncharacterized protein n=1 Tax=Callosobruchus maculatus TaxID=64391 RepID=A0A653DQ58_CALMS|nr:unnamed protein product [Callosobruchus maculatus]
MSTSHIHYRYRSRYSSLFHFSNYNYCCLYRNYSIYSVD